MPRALDLLRAHRERPCTLRQPWLFSRRWSCLWHQEPKDRRAKQAHRRNTQKCAVRPKLIAIKPKSARLSAAPIPDAVPMMPWGSRQTASSLVVAAMIILPQVLTAPMSPWVGRRAQTWGRRPLLLIGFGALPIRGLVSRASSVGGNSSPSAFAVYCSFSTSVSCVHHETSCWPPSMSYVAPVSAVLLMM